MKISSFGKLIVSFINYRIFPFISSCILIISEYISKYLSFRLFSSIFCWDCMASTIAIQQKRRCTWFPRINKFISFLQSVSYLSYVVRKHIFPKVSILKSEFLWDADAQPEVQNDQLMLFWVLGMWSDQHISRMRVTMNKSTDKYLLSKCSYQLIHDSLFIKIVLFHLVSICNFKAIDPFRNHNSFSRVLCHYIRHVQLWSFYLTSFLLSF